MAGLEGLLTPQSSESTTTIDGKKVSVDGTSVPKEGPSLFDSMLAQVTGKGTSTTEGEEESASSNSKQSTTQSTNLSSSKEGTKIAGENTATKGLTQSSGISLFDKMVSGAKESQTPTNQTQTPSQNNTTATQTIPTGVAATSPAQTQVADANGTNIATNTTKAADVKNTYTVSPEKIDEKALDSLGGDLKKTTSGEGKTTRGETLVSDKQQSSIPDTKTATDVVTGPKVGRHVGLESAKENTPTNTQATTQTKVNEEVSIDNKTKVENPNIKMTDLKDKTSPTQSVNSQDSKVLNQDSTKVATSVPLTKVAKDTNTQDVLANTKQASAQGIETPNNKVTQNTTTTQNVNDTTNVANNSSLNNKSENIVDNKLVSTTPKNKIADTNSKIVNTTKQTSSVETNSNKTDEGVKKSLADNLISTATATALANKVVDKSKGTDVKSTNTSNLTQTANTTTLSHTSPTSLSASDTISPSTQSVSDATPSQEIKTIEQNIVDKKVENKSIDLKNSDQKQQVIKTEKDQTLKATNVSTLGTAVAASTSKPSNEELASGLASIRETAKGEVTTINDNNVKTALKESMKKEDTLLSDKRQQNTNTLLDKMVKDTKSAATSDPSLASESLGAKDQFVQKDLPLFATAGYLHDQKKRNDIANMMKKNEGVLQAQNAKNVSDVKNSAQTLGLNVTQTEVIEEASQKEEVRVQNTRDDVLKRMVFDNNLGRKLHNNNQQIKTNEAIVASATALTNSTEEQVVEVAVSAEATQTIENRIIGARQSLRSMMSDVARQMAQNYKPPLTAFRINLNPSGLGNIAVMIKSEQSNGISISLNMSNTNTLETFVDNQSQLRAALTRNFDNATNFNLDFGMQQDSNSNQNQNDNRSNQNSNSSSSASESNIIAEQHSTEEVITQSNYM